MIPLITRLDLGYLKPNTTRPIFNPTSFGFVCLKLKGQKVLGCDGPCFKTELRLDTNLHFKKQNSGDNCYRNSLLDNKC